MNEIFIFDVDGVITDPHSKKPNERIIKFIVSQLGAQKPISIATGRSSSWVMRKIIPLIQENLSDDGLLDNLFVSGEKGGVWIEFFNGVARPSIDDSISFPKEVVKKIYQQVQGKQSIFFDKDKYTMVSLEIMGSEDTTKLKEQKKELDEICQWIQKEIMPSYPQITLEETIISVDIVVKGIDKRIAAKKFLTYLKKKQIDYDSFIMFGDSPSDALVPDELLKQGKQATFIYVGTKPLPPLPFPVIQNHTSKFDIAVVELLRNYQIIQQ